MNLNELEWWDSVGTLALSYNLISMLSDVLIQSSTGRCNSCYAYCDECHWFESWLFASLRTSICPPSSDWVPGVNQREKCKERNWPLSTPKRYGPRQCLPSNMLPRVRIEYGTELHFFQLLSKPRLREPYASDWWWDFRCLARWLLGVNAATMTYWKAK